MRDLLKTVAAAAVIALAGAYSASAEEIKVGFSPEAYPPFYQQDASGAWGGWEVEIINAICSEEKLDCVLTPIRSGRSQSWISLPSTKVTDSPVS